MDYFRNIKKTFYIFNKNLTMKIILHLATVVKEIFKTFIKKNITFLLVFKPVIFEKHFFLKPIKQIDEIALKVLFFF